MTENAFYSWDNAHRQRRDVTNHGLHCVRAVGCGVMFLLCNTVNNKLALSNLWKGGCVSMRYLDSGRIKASEDICGLIMVEWMQVEDNVSAAYSSKQQSEHTIYASCSSKQHMSISKMDVWMITRWVKDNLCSNKEHISTRRMNKWIKCMHYVAVASTRRDLPRWNLQGLQAPSW
jgi:hypothetical protein